MNQLGANKQKIEKEIFLWIENFKQRKKQILDVYFEHLINFVKDVFRSQWPPDCSKKDEQKKESVFCEF